jgi:hypothetical protein
LGSLLSGPPKGGPEILAEETAPIVSIFSDTSRSHHGWTFEKMECQKAVQSSSAWLPPHEHLTQKSDLVILSLTSHEFLSPILQWNQFAHPA